MHNNCIPKCILLYWQHWGSQRKDEVNWPWYLVDFEKSKIFECLNFFIFVFRAFANQIQRPFGLRYNPYTQSVEVLTDAQKITALVSELRGDLCIVSNALRKIHEQDDTVDVERITSLLTQGIDLPQDTSSSDSDEDKSPNVDERLEERPEDDQNNHAEYRR